MREQRAQFERRGVRVACVVQGTATEAAQFCSRYGFEQACIPDPDKASYRAMGFGRALWKDMIFASPGLRARRKEASAAGCRVSLEGTFRKHTDILQLPGAALVAPGGKILWLHRGTHPGDMPSAAELLKAVDATLPAQ